MYDKQVKLSENINGAKIKKRRIQLDNIVILMYNYTPMEMGNIIFIVNLILLAGMIAYHCYKNRSKAIVFNVALLILFILIKLTEVRYVAIRAGLFDFLGPERFAALRSVLNQILIFSSSVTVGVQILIQFISILLLVFLAASVIVILTGKSSGKIFSSRVLPEDDGFCQNRNFASHCLYLILGKLLC